MTPLVSVITPTGSRAAFLQQALVWFRDQDYSRLEWLVLDDSVEVDEAFAALPDPNIHYEHYAGPRLTTGEKRNRLIDKAQGEIIVHFDDDDFYAPDYITTMVNTLTENDADIMNLRGWYLFDRRFNFFGYWDLMRKVGLHYRCHQEGLLPIMIDPDNPVLDHNNHLGYGFTYAYKRRVWESHQFTHKDLIEDGEFMLAAATQFKISGIHDITGRCLHILHIGSISCCYPQYCLPNFELLQRFPTYARRVLNVIRCK